jgi:hypothetical protein
MLALLAVLGAAAFLFYAQGERGPVADAVLAGIAIAGGIALIGWFFVKPERRTEHG